MNLKDKKVLVVGLGKSGMAAYELLKKMGALVSLYDGNKEMKTEPVDVPVYLGDFPEDISASFDCAVFSPGVPLDIPAARHLIHHKVQIGRAHV